MPSQHRMLATIHHMLTDGTAYADPGPDHFRTNEPMTRAKVLARQLVTLPRGAISAAPVSIQANTKSSVVNDSTVTPASRIEPSPPIASRSISAPWASKLVAPARLTDGL